MNSEIKHSMQTTTYTWTTNCQKQNAYVSVLIAAGPAMQKMCFPPKPRWMAVNIAVQNCFLTVNA